MRAIYLAKPKGLRFLQLYRLYRSSFPAAERKPFFYILRQARKGIMDIWCLEENGSFLGLATTVKGEQLVLIDYLAIDPSVQGQGVGSAALVCLRQQYAGRDVFLEIESVFEDCENLPDRKRRKAFYLRCGMKPMGVMVSLFGVKMELMGFGRAISYREYEDFYLTHMGAWAAGHVFPESYP